MSVTVKIKPLKLDYQVSFGGALSDKRRSQILAAYAREKLDDAKQRNAAGGHTPPPFETFVDGVAEAPLENVKPNGMILFKFQLLGEALRWVHEQLVAHSPERFGRYEHSHVLYADGTECDPESPPEDAREYVFLNLQPYARKIERGESPAAPEGVYEAVATLAQARFGRIASFDFTYRAPAEGEVVDWATSRSRVGRTRNTRTQRRHDTNQPAIVVTRG